MSSLFSLGSSALAASYAAMATTGHNIANANVKGYSRQQVELATAEGQFSGAGFFGAGVSLSTVSRAHDDLLTREAVTANALAAMDASRLEWLNRLEAVFPGGEQGLGYAAGQFLNSLADWSARPADLSARQVVLARAGDAAERFAAAGSQLETLQQSLHEDLGAQVEQVNRLAASLAELNQRIAAASGLGHAPNDLLDQRDRVLDELSGYLQLSTIAADDGSLSVFVAGGQLLVLGNQARTLAVQPDPADRSRVALAIADAGGLRRLQDGDLAGGSMAALLHFQNGDLVDARTGLGRIAAALAGAVNAQQALGLDLGDPPGRGVPIFAVAAPVAVPNAANAVDALGRFVGQVNLTVADATQLQASEYTLRADPAGAPGTWQLTRLADGLVRRVSSGDTVDGFRIDIGPPSPAAGDRFLLQPVTHAAEGLRRVLDDPRGLAAASPVTASADAANRGTGAVSALRVVDAAIDPEQTASIRFTSDSGDYSWELRDRLTNALLSSGSALWRAGTPIVLNGFELDLNGVPRDGDAFGVSKTAFPKAQNGNALALLGLRDAALVGGGTLTDAYAALMGGVGVRVQGAATSAEVSSAVAAQAGQARSAKSGVDLDEEAARLIQYQQSYQAAAKVLQVAQAAFDALLDAAGG
jgi:flagellar hook-associated protein 1 FlgK